MLPRPTVTEPPPGTTLLPGDTAFDLASVGYEQSEFFLDGTANAYSSAVPLASDGEWTVTSSLPRTYTTRIVVNRPADPSRFNGTVVVEWLNVSGRRRRQPRLDAHARRADPRGLRVGRRLGAGGRRERG